MVFGGTYESNTSAISAGACSILELPAAKKKIVTPPYNHLILFNNDDVCPLKVVLDAGIANNELVNGRETFFVQPHGRIEIKVEDKIFFEWVAVENIHATNSIAIGNIKFSILNS